MTTTTSVIEVQELESQMRLAELGPDPDFFEKHIDDKMMVDKMFPKAKVVVCCCCCIVMCDSVGNVVGECFQKLVLCVALCVVLWCVSMIHTSQTQMC